MSAKIALYKDQLPKIKSLNVLKIYTIIGTTASLLAIFLGFVFGREGKIFSEYVFEIFLCIIVLLLIGYIYIRERLKLHRYAETVYFVHFVNHLIRDTLAYIQNNKPQDIDNRIQEILFAIATSFSILTGKTCTCVLEEMRPTNNGSFEVVSVNKDFLADDVIDRMSKRDNFKHYIDDNTDFKNLWYSINGCSRYYLCNNVRKEWKARKYQHSYFKIKDVGEPELVTFLGLFSFVTRWPLNFRSCLILPIRFIGDAEPPVSGSNSGKSTNGNGWDFWGFLCIYCNSTKVFNHRYGPELGLSFADLLYVFLNQLKKQISSKEA